MEELEHEVVTSKEIIKKIVLDIDQELHVRGMYANKKKLSWQQLVGEPLGSGSSIKRLEEGVLLIACKHSSYLQMLMLQKQAILKKLQAEYASLQVMMIKGQVVEHWPELKESVTVPPRAKDAATDEQMRAMFERLRSLGR